MIGVPKDPEYRNRALLDLAHREDAECGNCGRYGPCDPGHSNLGEDGKGTRHKSHDCFFAMLCVGPAGCHNWLDREAHKMDPTGRFQPTREGKREMWTLAFKHSILLMWRKGWIAVAEKR